MLVAAYAAARATSDTRPVLQLIAGAAIALLVAALTTRDHRSMTARHPMNEFCPRQEVGSMTARTYYRQ